MAVTGTESPRARMNELGAREAMTLFEVLFKEKKSL